MALDEPPTAIVAAGDTLALGALRQLRRAQLQVGTDIALVSFDDPVSGDLLEPPMTALVRHDRELGEISARMLLDELDAAREGPGAAGSQRDRTAPGRGQASPRVDHPPQLRLRTLKEQEHMSRPVTLFTGQWADMPAEELAAKAGRWGFDGLELACWGDHFSVQQALSGSRLRQGAARPAQAARP